MASGTCPSCAGPVDAQSGVCPACATQVLLSSGSPGPERVAPASERPLSFRGYRILRQLGQGGMGAVYLAEEESLGRNVAIKVISGSISGDPQAGARFQREARTLATIEHPHVVRVYSFGESDGRAFLVMEFVEGETLIDRLEHRGRFATDEALRIALQIIEALEAAWERRIVHRDIKPSNILLDSRNQVRVADFGLAKPLDAAVDTHATQSGYLLGTPHYLSPEQAQGENVDFRSDIYALGIMLFQMLTGARPFEGTTPVAIVAKHLHERLPSLRARRPDLPEGLERLIEWMTAKSPAARPKSYTELAEAMRALRDGEEDPATMMVTTPMRRTRAQRAQWVVLFVIVMLFLMLMFIPVRRPGPPAPPASDGRLVVAIAPFYGPDKAALDEGRTMAALIERAVHERIGTRNARVLGIEEIGTPVRDHDAARQLGAKLGANAVIWGQVFVLRNETEIEPHVTILEIGAREEEAGGQGDEAGDEVTGVARGSGPLKLRSEAPNQIELRKGSASGVSDAVAILAAIHALDSQRQPRRALTLLRDVPRSAETLRLEAKALLDLGGNEEAAARLEAALALDPLHAQTLATLGDIALSVRRFDRAFELFQRAEQTGAPFVTGRGFMQRDRLFVHETYVTKGREVPTIYLIELSRDGRYTLARHSLPGEPRRFARDGDAVTITYATKHRRTAELVMRENAFDRYLWPPVELSMRIRSMRAGQVLPANFLADFAGAPTAAPAALRMVPHPQPSLPATLPLLEARLAEAIEADPTQPWHRFFRAVTLRELQRPQEAEREFAALLRTRYPGIHYYELAWMMSILERMQVRAWEEALFAKALAQRNAMPAPVTAGTLTERQTNAPFTRAAAVRRDPERGWTVLDQARRLSGLSLESDDVVAALWARYFDERGDPRAEEERRILAGMRDIRLNLLASAMRIEYAFVCAAGACIALLVLGFVYGITAAGRVRRITPRTPVPPLVALLGERLARATRSLPRLALIAGATFLGGGFAAALLLAAATGAIDGAWIFLVLCAIGVTYVMRMLHAAPSAVAAALQPGERRVVLAALGVAVAATLLVSSALAPFGPLLATPVGFADSPGHAHIVASLEADLVAKGDRPALRYAAAVANHLAGNRERARQLYTLLGTDPRATRNLEALERGAMPALPLSLDDIAAARLPPRSATELAAALRGVLGIASRPGLPAFLIVFLGIILLLLYAVRPDPRFATMPPPDGLGMRMAMLLVPRLYDLRRGRPLLGYLAVLAAAFLFLPAIVLIGAGSPVAAVPFTNDLLPDIAASQPVPGPVRGLAVRLAFPYAHLFWGAFVVAILLVIVVHALRIRAILRSTCVPSSESLLPLPR